ncbi:MAG: sigma-70 family RNA polymerase sigma factor [Acidobacteriaceae bacterium]
MAEREWLADEFEQSRGHLRGVAYRMLGSVNEADDAVQECWLRLSRTNTSGVENLRGWLTTVVSRVCLDMLRSRKSRREESLETPGGEAPKAVAHAADPETEAVMADSVGFALLVVLDRLNPAERLAFVLHDLFDLPFEEIARIAGRTPEATRQLASRARRRVRGVTAVPKKEIAQQRALADAFLTALRAGDAAKLVTLLDPQFAVLADATAAAAVPVGIQGAEAWAKLAIQSARGAKFARAALVDGAVGVVVAPRGKLFRVLRLTFAGGRIAGMEVVGDPERLRSMRFAVLDE